MGEERTEPKLLDRVLPWLLAALATLAALGAVARFLTITDPDKRLDGTTLLYLGVAGALLLLREVKTLSFGDYKVEFERMKQKVEEVEKKSEAAIQGSQSAQTTAENAMTTAVGVGGGPRRKEPEESKPQPPRPLSLGTEGTKGTLPSRGIALSRTETEDVEIDEDPLAGRFGEESERNGRRLSATVSSLAGSSETFEIRLKVESTDSSDPLQGNVEFFLHPSFPNDHPIVAVSPNGTAEIMLRAWGAFTVGAVCDKGATKLELDLADLEGAPALFRAR